MSFASSNAVQPSNSAGVRPVSFALSQSRPECEPQKFNALLYFSSKNDTVKYSFFSISSNVFLLGLTTVVKTGAFHTNPSCPHEAVIVLYSLRLPLVRRNQSLPMSLNGLNSSSFISVFSKFIKFSSFQIIK